MPPQIPNANSYAQIQQRKHPLTTALLNSLHARHLSPSKTWLQTFLSSQTQVQTQQQNQKHLNALTSTASFRILASDITKTCATTSISGPGSGSGSSLSGPEPGTGAGNCIGIFPAHISSPSTIARQLSQSDILVQILDLVDIGRSLGVQIEEWEAVLQDRARGVNSANTSANARGAVQRVVDVPAFEDDEEDDEGHADGGRSGFGNMIANMSNSNGNSDSSRPADASLSGSGPYKVLLQDISGALVWAFDADQLLRLSFSSTSNLGSSANTTGSTGSAPVTIGTKLLLKRGTNVARGVVLIERGNVQVLGGRIEMLEKAWIDGRMGRLMAERDKDG